MKKTFRRTEKAKRDRGEMNFKNVLKTSKYKKEEITKRQYEMKKNKRESRKSTTK
jgi:hypothetical protein